MQKPNQRDADADEEAYCGKVKSQIPSSMAENQPADLTPAL
jgi:hypothetical protein